MSMAITQKSAM